VVLVSKATFSAEDMPRDAALLLSRNRFNVASSRAQCGQLKMDLTAGPNYKPH
jgi:hypothetical protein